MKATIAKRRTPQIVEAQPEDISDDQILDELAFERMIERGLDDVQEGRTISSEEMLDRIGSWGA